MDNFEYDLACKLFLENIIKNNYGIADNELLTHDVIMNFEETISNFLNKNILFEETSINNECFYDVFNYINKNLKDLTKHKLLHTADFVRNLKEDLKNMKSSFLYTKHIDFNWLYSYNNY